MFALLALPMLVTFICIELMLREEDNCALDLIPVTPLTRLLWVLPAIFVWLGYFVLWAVVK